MKRLSILLFFLVLAEITLAQEDFYNDYMITVTGVVSVVGEDPDKDCGSGIWYYLDFENGERLQVVGLPMSDMGNYNFSGSLIFSSKNKVKGLYSVTQNQKRRGGISNNCGSGPPINASVAFNPTYPCHNGTINHTSGIYHFNTTVDIKPLSKKSIKLSASIKLEGNSLEEHLNDPLLSQPNVILLPYSFVYSLALRSKDGSSENIFSESDGFSYTGYPTVREGTFIYPLMEEPVMTLAADRSVSFIYAPPGGTIFDWQVLDRKWLQLTREFADIQIPGTTTFDFVLYQNAAPSRITLTTNSFSFPIKYLSGTDNILPDEADSRVTLQGPAGNPASFYHWVYSTDGQTWTDLPARFQGNNRIAVSGYDIFGDAVANVHSKNIFLKIIIDCNGGESATLTLSRRTTAPAITSVTPISDRCYNTLNDGAFKIRFSRPLLRNGADTETLSILLTDPADPELTIKQFLNVTLDADNSFECPRGLTSGRSYLVRLIGTYQGSATYTDNPVTHTSLLELVRPQPVTSTLAAEDVHCYNGGDGKINITAAGGAGNYSLEYVKPGGETLQLPLGSAATTTIDFLRPGNYAIQVRDGNGCSDQAGTKNIAVNQPLSALQMGYSATTDPLAYGNTDGFIETILQGGTPDTGKQYTLEWYRSGNPLPASLQNNAVLANGYQANINGIGEGPYTLKAYDSRYALAHPDHRAGCYIESAVFTLRQPPPLVVTIHEDRFVSCYDATDGTLSASVQGGVAIPGPSPYRYEWLIVENGTPRPTGQTTNIATQLKAGVYMMKVTDQNNIEKLSSPFTLGQPGLLHPQVTTSPVSCFGGGDGKAEASVQGGTLPYTYEWDEGSITSAVNSLTAGTYFVLVTDARGCSASASGTVNSPQPVSSTMTAEAVHCYDGGDGKINIVARGGVGNYTFEYVKPGSTQTISASMGSGTTAVIDFLRQGLHTIQLRDGNGCDDKDGIKHITVTQPSPLYIGRAATTPPRAFGYTDGTIETTVLGGTPNGGRRYTIEWYDPVNLLPATLQNNAVLTGAYQANISGIGDGAYILKVYDSQYALANPDHRAGCHVQSEVFTLVQPPPLVVTIRQNHNVSCYGYDDGELTAIAQGGIKIPGDIHYKYDWLTVDNGTPRPVGKTDSTANRLKAGIYQVRITDRNDIEKISDPFALDQPAHPISSTVTAEAVHCYNGGDGKISIVARGGIGNYSFEYVKPGSAQAIRVSMGAETEAVIDMLQHGTYTVYVHDSNNCNDTDGIKSIEVSQPSAPLRTAHTQTTDPLAYGYTDGFIMARVADGTPYADKHYTVEWYDPTSLLPATLQDNAALADGYQAGIRGLGDGAYILKAYDSQYPLAHPDHRAGCYAESQVLKLIQPPPLLVTVHERHYVSCNGFSDGALQAHAKGGIKISDASPYRYEWLAVENGTRRAINQSDSIATQLKSGVYCIKITDKNGIEKVSDPFTLVQPGVLKAQVATTPVSCSSGQDGTAACQVQGGSAPFAYAWSTGSTASQVSQLIEGNYFVWVKDTRGCTTTASEKVTSPFTLTVDSQVRNPQCFGYTNGAIDINVKEGTAPYRYEWSTGAITEDIAGITEGTYRVLIVDGNSCHSYRAYDVKNPAPIRIDLGGERYLCNDQQYQADGSWTDSQASYLWTGPDGFTATTPKVALTREGTYHVYITDSQGCRGEDELTIKRLGIDISAEFIVSTQAFADTEVTLLNVSNPEPDSVLWEAANGAGSINFTLKENRKTTVVFSEEGAYTLSLKAYRQGCEAVFSKTITVLGKSFDDGAREESPFIEEFTVSPVPARGPFTVTIKLREAAAIRLRLISIVNNAVVNDRMEQGSSEYTLPYTVNLAAGTYLLLMESPNGNTMAKVIVL